ncbi:hypothetical protein EDC04DRAFT_1241844 [Pisolithus marmoratus]|nr:hypothetical protein EDC04DRAFT_1241844 [Pisolithus marmoratus]
MTASSGIEYDNPLIPVWPPSEFTTNPLEAYWARDRTRACHQAKVGGRAGASEPISRRAGHLSKIRSRPPMRPTVVRQRRYPNVWMCCGWQNEGGGPCGARVTYNNCAEHFAAVHRIKNMAADVEVLCRWCPLSEEMKLTRKNLLRHLREVHLHCPR